MQMRIRKVAIYARVSTEHEAQLSALENQVQYYDGKPAEAHGAAARAGGWGVFGK